MNEARFIKLNKERWAAYELELQLKMHKNPDELAYRYIQILDDLSYARTYFPQSSTVTYLNGLAVKSHGQIYVNRKERWSRILKFWTTGLPTLFYTYRRFLLYSFIAFIVSALIGALSAANDDTFTRLILGDGYVNMTLENIKRGEPLGVYDSQNQFIMFISIAFNNIYVSFYTFLLGMLTSLGSLSSIFRNGVMMGSFQMFFWQHNLSGLFIRTVFLHGVIELSSIIIAGAAGWMLGNALLFPGTYTRLESLKTKARDAAKIAFGIVPLFIIAAFIESFITRLKMPAALGYFIVLLTLAFIIWYVIILPYRLHNKYHPHEPIK